MNIARLAVVGAGLIGRRHVERIAACAEATLACIVDPTPDAAAYAESLGTAWYDDIDEMLREVQPDGVIVATPNQLHVVHGRACIEAGVPALIEKPIADDAAAAQELVEAAEAAGVPILVGHHRRHNPLIAAAKARIEAGDIGRIVAVQGTCWFYKPDRYFDVAWRTQPGAGPILINLIHDIDLLRHLCGEIRAVQAIASNGARGHAVEDTAAVILEFETGALGTITVSDSIAAPWSWELTSGENPDYPKTDQSCYLIGGSAGALEIPASRVWRHPGEPSWVEPIDAAPYRFTAADPLARQIAHFCRVTAGAETPLVSGREGIKTLQVVEAIHRAARIGARVEPGT